MDEEIQERAMMGSITETRDGRMRFVFGVPLPSFEGDGFEMPVAVWCMSDEGELLSAWSFAWSDPPFHKTLCFKGTVFKGVLVGFLFPTDIIPPNHILT